MAVRTNASGEYLRRTANLPALNAYSMSGWFYLVARPASGAFGTFLSFDKGAGPDGYHALAISMPGGTPTFIVETNGNTAGTGTVPALNAWHFMAMTSNGTTVVAYHCTAVGVWQSFSVAHTTFTPTGLFWCNDGFDDWSDARVSQMRAWDAVLTQDEIKAEAWRSRPSRFANLNLWCPGMPGATERLRDYGPNARNLTAGGTLTDEAGPPLPVMWDAPLGFPWKVAAAPGGDPEGSLLGGKLLRGGLLTHGVLVRG